MIDAWANELAEALGVEALGPEEISDLLDAARDVAHGVERRITPVSTFLLGVSMERRVAGGAARDRALREAIGTLEELIARTPPGEVS